MKLSMNYEEIFFEADGISLKYITTGKGMPLLFLHGGGVSAFTYKNNFELLSQKYHVIAPDIPCFGESSIPNKLWDFEDFANCLCYASENGFFIQKFCGKIKERSN